MKIEPAYIFNVQVFGEVFEPLAGNAQRDGVQQVNGFVFRGDELGWLAAGEGIPAGTNTLISQLTFNRPALYDQGQYSQQYSRDHEYCKKSGYEYHPQKCEKYQHYLKQQVFFHPGFAHFVLPVPGFGIFSNLFNPLLNGFLST